MAAEKGVFEAQNYLAGAYLTGNGVSKNVIQGAKWMQAAAAHDNAEAQCNLAILYQTGTGLPQSYGKAMFWYQKAADRGYSKAQFNLGALYGNGIGTPKDLVNAYKWIFLAQRNGYADTKQALDWLKPQMTAGQIDEAQRQVETLTTSGISH